MGEWSGLEEKAYFFWFYQGDSKEIILDVRQSIAINYFLIRDQITLLKSNLRSDLIISQIIFILKTILFGFFLTLLTFRKYGQCHTKPDKYFFHLFCHKF